MKNAVVWKTRVEALSRALDEEFLQAIVELPRSHDLGRLAEADLDALQRLAWIRINHPSQSEIGEVNGQDRSIGRVAGPGFIQVTASGATFSEGLLSALKRGIGESIDALPNILSAWERPTWDRQRRLLRVGPFLVKRFRQPAKNQIELLEAFEQKGWTVRITDPLSTTSDIDPPTRLHDTIKTLNRNQQCRLLQFRGDGTGGGVIWNFRSDFYRRE